MQKKISSIICHVGDKAANQVMEAIASPRRCRKHKRILGPAVQVPGIRDGQPVSYTRRTANLFVPGGEYEISLITIPQETLSKATVLVKEHLRYDEVLYITVMSSHPHWLDIEPSGTTLTRAVFRKPGCKYSALSGFDTFFMINDLSMFPKDECLAEAVSDEFASHIMRYLVAPACRENKQSRGPAAKGADFASFVERGGE